MSTSLQDLSSKLDSLVGIQGTLGVRATRICRRNVPVSGCFFLLSQQSLLTLLRVVSLQYVTIVLTLVAGYTIAQNLLFARTDPAPAVDTAEKENEEEEDDTEPPRNFTAKQLLYFDGKPDKDGDDKPVYLSVNGIVFDMSTGRNFYGPGGPYEAFAGHECGVALAKMSFDKEHLDNLEGCAKLNFGEKTELDNWIEKFQYYRNYPIVGRLVASLPNKEWTLEEMATANAETPEGYAAAPIYVAVKGKVVRIVCDSSCFSKLSNHLFFSYNVYFVQQYDMSFGGVSFYGKGYVPTLSGAWCCSCNLTNSFYFTFSTAVHTTSLLQRM